MKLLRITVLMATMALATHAHAAPLHNPLAKPYAAPEFEGLAGWLNSKPLSTGDDLKILLNRYNS